jgi:phosphoribosylamine-glycine ligase
VASRGYPENAEKGALVAPIPEQAGSNSVVFHASTTCDPAGRTRTGGGRCFTAVGTGRDLTEASIRAYAAAETVRFDGAWFRRDIGRKFVQ